MTLTFSVGRQRHSSPQSTRPRKRAWRPGALRTGLSARSPQVRWREVPAFMRRETRVRRAWTGARTSPHAFRAVRGSAALFRAQSGVLARCARPATIHREAGANGTGYSRLAARSQPGTSGPRARARAMRRSTTVYRGTRPCLLARVEDRAWRGSCHRRSSRRRRAVCSVSHATRPRSARSSPAARSGRRER